MPGQKKGTCGHLFPFWDKHSLCPKCRGCTQAEPCLVCVNWDGKKWSRLRVFFPSTSSISTLGSQSISSEMGLSAPETSSDISMSFTTGVTVGDDSGAYNRERSDRTTGPLLCVSTSLNSSPSNLSGTVLFLANALQSLVFRLLGQIFRPLYQNQ